MTRQEQEAIERLKEHISAILLYVAEAKLNKEEVENELLNIEALIVAIETIESKSKLESATTIDEVVDFNNMISAGGRIRNHPLPINTVEKPDINTTGQGRSQCNTCKYSDRLQIEEPCFSCIAGFRNYEPVKPEPDKNNYKESNCLGCRHFDEEHTNRICYDCKRAYKDRYER